MAVLLHRVLHCGPFFAAPGLGRILITRMSFREVGAEMKHAVAALDPARNPFADHQAISTEMDL